MPKFNQLKLLYPGYYHHGGTTRDRELIHHILGTTDHKLQHPHNTASLRMSWTLNRYSGRHSIGKTPVFLSGEGRDSLTGTDGQEYIFRNTAFGPYLAGKYGNPIYTKTHKDNHFALTLEPFMGKQGIIRFLSYHTDHAGGHIGLWDCDHFYQTRDWTSEHHIISVEFWESPDSYCPSKSQTVVEPPKLVPLKPGSTVIARHNLETSKHKSNNGRTVGRHKLDRRNRGKVTETLWLQDES